MSAKLAGVAFIGIERIDDVLRRAPSNIEDWLSTSEQSRLESIRHIARRNQYVAGHWLARTQLANAMGGNAEKWRLDERKGLPPLVTHRDDACVSISHTKDWIAAAVATVPIGIDLEQRPRRLDAAIEPLLLNLDERPGSLDADVLLQRWVAKEAWLKRTGRSALPEQIKRLQLQPTASEYADVQIHSHVAFHFGLAVAADCAVALRSAVPLSVGAIFLVHSIDGCSTRPIC